VAVRLSPAKAKEMDIAVIDASEESFRYEMNKSKLATDLLSQGIRSFEKDGNELKEIIRKRISELYPTPAKE
jgi:transaldolase